MEWLTARFCDAGADIIRLNLAHIESGEIPGLFAAIKRGLLGWEKKNPGRPVALLADLPGPKVRFHFDKPMNFTLNQPFTVHLNRIVPAGEADSATVYVGKQPLQRVLEKATDRGLYRPRGEHDSRTFLNVFGLAAGPEPPTMASLLNRLQRVDRPPRIVVGDGEVVMSLEAIDGASGSLVCRVVSVKKSPLTGKRGFTLSGVDLPVAAFTADDEEKLNLLLETDLCGPGPCQPVLAYLGLSFTQTADDVLRCRQRMERRIGRLSGVARNRQRMPLTAPAVIAKIETRLGWENRHHILDVADGLMVARGDLGLQMPMEEVPSMQKRLIRLCQKRGKPVITATEMLKSMTSSQEPTRAESTDVFNAILDGSDAIMTAEETAIGRYPLHAIAKMEAIALQAEAFSERAGGENDDEARTEHLRRYEDFMQDDYARIRRNTARLREIVGLLDEGIAAGSLPSTTVQRMRWRRRLYQEKWGRSCNQSTTNRITEATCTMSEAPEIRAILAATTSGRTVRMIARLRPTVPVIGATHDALAARKLIISYGVTPLDVGSVQARGGIDALFDRCVSQVRKHRGLKAVMPAGSMIVFTAGAPLGVPGTTNMIQMRRI